MSSPRSKTRKVRIGMMSLGCPKTLVDSENILGKLDASKYQLAESVGDCDVAVLNTCAFIQDAQQESLDRILELVTLKKEKQISAVIVLGCLVQRFPKDLQGQLKDVDAFVGSGEYAKIPEIVDRVAGGQKVFTVGKPGYLATSGEQRITLTPSHYRYVKISEGCDHVCTFCSIPSFRGKHRSRTIDDVVSEAKSLVSQGAKELILTGQDTTYFGRDTAGEYLLPELLRRLDSEAEGADWIRLLYAYPACITTGLMETIRESKRICHYLDMPLQHASDRMLAAMKRGITKRRTIDLIQKFRELVPDLAIRTTFIVGFPGETEKDFEELLQFMEAMQFERLGIFIYSLEDDTPAAEMPDQVPEKIKRKRWKQAMELQQKIAESVNRKFVGKTLQVLIEEHAEKPKQWIGRSYMDAPEVDGNVFIKTNQALEIGKFYPAKITATQEYDLVGEV